MISATSREELGAIAPFDVGSARQSDEGFVDQGGGLQRVIGTLAAQPSGGQPFQLRIHQRDQFHAGGIVAVLHLFEQQRDLIRRQRIHTVLAIKVSPCIIVKHFE